MGCTVAHYWEQHTQRIERSLSVAVGDQPNQVGQITLIDGDETRGFIDARIYFHDEEVFLEVHEKVRTTGDENGTPHRERYAYQLMVKGVRAGRWHFDPALPSQSRYHFDDELNDTLHIPDSQKSLKDVIRAAWLVITELLSELERQ